jgi:PIN domain nuclease of toxin-antitoxin system
MNSPNAPLLLDTHIWIWLMLGNSELKPELVVLIEQVARNSQLYISDISTWELSMLVAKGRIQLKQDVLQWIQLALKVPGLQCLPLSVEVLVESSRLPGTCHGDPADRMLIATARHHGLCLITRDEKILTYANQGFLETLSA